MFEMQMAKVLTGLVVIVPAILLIRWLLHRGGQSPDDFVEEHVRILKQKYAQGEISEAEYQRKMDDFMSD